MRSRVLLCLIFQFVFYSCSLEHNENLSFFYKCIDEYRQDFDNHYNKSDDDSLFYLIAFFKKDDKYEILLNANDVEIPKMIERPSPDKKMEINKNFIGYKEYKNNFLFIYDYSDGEIPVLLSPLTEYLEKDIKSNRLLSKYNTENWTLDSKCWRLYFDNNLKLRCKK